jgi:chorismate mutase
MSDRAHDPSDTPEAAPEGLDDQMTTLRNQIDELDKQIVKLLNDRAECALDLGRLKEQAGLDTYQPDREIQVLEHARQVNSGPLEGDAITRLFERIIDENRRLERLAEGKD